MAISPFEGLQLILLLTIAALMVHQFEEYHVPGGEPWILNEVFQPRGGPVDRFPLNQGNAAFINILAWPFYLVPALFPGVVWLGIGQIIFGMVGQLVIHGVITNIRLKTIYNPGLAAVVFGHVPLGIWYLVVAYGDGVVAWTDWVWGILYMLGFLVIFMMIIGYRVMLSKNSKWAFAPEEVDRFNRLKHLRHAGIEPLPFPLDGNPPQRAIAHSTLPVCTQCSAAARQRANQGFRQEASYFPTEGASGGVSQPRRPTSEPLCEIAKVGHRLRPWSRRRWALRYCSMRNSAAREAAP